MNQIKIIKEMLENELEKIKGVKVLVMKSLKKAPEGSLIVSKSNGTIQFFQKTEKNKKKGRYIKKQENNLIHALAQKDYDLALYQELERQEAGIEKALRALPEKEMIQVFDKLIEVRKELVDSHILTDEEYVKAWLDIKYEGNHFHEENKKYETERGELVRSKSEKIIADKLYVLGIPYRYEYPIQIKGRRTIYPDFTILMVSSRTEIYLEHFGMMDVAEYCENALLRIQELAHYGIMVGRNLITTFESSTVPLDIKTLDVLRNLK